MRKIFLNIHLWLSIPFGLLITLICFSGAMLVFEKEVMETSNPQLYYVDKVGKNTLPLDVLAEKVGAVLPDSVQVTGITVFSNPEKTYQVNLSKPRRASMYIDPYTGEIKGKYERSPFFSTMFKMHRWMMGSARADDGSIGWGRLIVGVSTLMFVFVLISGVVVWWPRNKKVLKNRLSVNFKKGLRRLLYDLHVTGGIYLFVFLLAMSLTGLTWSFEWYRNGFYSIFGVETPKANTHNSLQTKTDKGKGKKGKSELLYTQWQNVCDELVTRNPDYEQITISNGSANVSFNHWGNQRASDKYTFDTRTGEIKDVTKYENSPDTSKIRGWIYSVHVGSWGGMFTRLLAFFAALFGATLPITGYYLWIKKKMQKK